MALTSFRRCYKREGFVIPEHQRDAWVRAYLEDVFNGHNLHHACFRHSWSVLGGPKSQLGSTSGHHDLGALVDELSGCREADPARATSDDHNLVHEAVH